MLVLQIVLLMQARQYHLPYALNKKPNDSVFVKKYNEVKNISHKFKKINTEPIYDKKEIQHDLLKSLDAEAEFWNQRSMPRGLNNIAKYPKRAQSPRFYRPSNKSIPLAPTFHLKTIRQSSSLRKKNQSRKTNRSNQSRTSIYSSHSTLNKRKSPMSQYYEQKQNQKLVQRLLCVKPSDQVNRQKQRQSFQKHLKLKNVMLHRVEELKKANNQKMSRKNSCFECLDCDSYLLKSIQREQGFTKIMMEGSKRKVQNGNMYGKRKDELKLNSLRKMLKQEKRNNHLMKMSNSKNSIFTLIADKNVRRMKTLQTKVNRLSPYAQKKKIYAVPSYVLPQIRSYQRASESAPVKKINLADKKDKHFKKRHLSQM